MYNNISVAPRRPKLVLTLVSFKLQKWFCTLWKALLKGYSSRVSRVSSWCPRPIRNLLSSTDPTRRTWPNQVQFWKFQSLTLLSFELQRSDSILFGFLMTRGIHLDYSQQLISLLSAQFRSYKKKDDPNDPKEHFRTILISLLCFSDTIELF